MSGFHGQGFIAALAVLLSWALICGYAVLRKHFYLGEKIPPLAEIAEPLDDAEKTTLESGAARAIFSQLPFDPEEERWRDMAGNRYSRAFVSSFSYANSKVTVEYSPSGATFFGKLKASGLKPNFAYQLKLRGDYLKDPEGHQTIGLVGRWRLPGGFTNYTDDEYYEHPDKSEVESYILFDYFVTDNNGEAQVEFKLKSSLHVLWSAPINSYPSNPDTPIREIRIIPDGAAYDAGIRGSVTDAKIWAENEGIFRNRVPVGKASLPERQYRAALVLTEESFHQYEDDDGHWATVLMAPVEFSIINHEK